MKKLIVLLTLIVICSTAQAEQFGATTVGASSNTFSSEYKEGSKFNLSEAGDIDSIGAYMKGDGASSPVTFMIYDDDGGVPLNLVATSAEVTVTTTLQWWAGLVSPAVELAAGDYWICRMADIGAPIRYYDATGGAYEWRADAYADGPSDPWGTHESTSARKLSGYAHYTPTGGAGTTTNPRRRRILSGGQ